jgi:lipoprotein NlpD
MKTSLKLTSLVSCIALFAGCATTTPAPVQDRSARGGGQPVPQPIGSAPAPIYDRSAPSATTSGAPIVSVTPIPSSAPISAGTPLPGSSGAPVITGGPSGAQTGPSGVSGNTPGSQFHVVQKGENLYRIALNNGLDLNNFAAWNNITPVTPIREGQVLRLRPLDPNAPTATSGANGAPRLIDGQALSGAPISVQPIPPASAPGSPGAAPLSVTPIEAPTRRDPRAQRLPYTDGALAQMQREAASSSAATAATPVAPNAGAAAAATASASTATTATTPPANAPVIESQIRPGAGIEHEGVAWTWPTSGRIASKFNERAAMKGIDISANVGTPVVAAAAGKVIYVGKEPRGFGQMIVVSHAKETVSVYFHTDKVAVKEQQRVTLGQRMAEVSDASGSKMHFEVRRAGRPIDPIALMPNP